MYFPHVIETTGRSSKAFDLPTKLLQDKIVYLCGEIGQESANAVIMQLLWLNSEDPEQEINLYINSMGGSVYEGLGIKDIIHSISNPVNTVGVGSCMSMGAYLLACGTGTRKATKNCRVMIHSISSGSQGTFHDLKVDFEETKHLQEQMISDLASFSKGNITKEELGNKTTNDWFMSSQQAVDEGFIDLVV